MPLTTYQMCRVCPTNKTLVSKVFYVKLIVVQPVNDSPIFFWNPELCYLAFKILPLVPFLIQLNSVYTFTKRSFIMFSCLKSYKYPHNSV